MQGVYRTWLAHGRSRRWLVVGGGLLINLALGVRHAWSVFRAPGGVRLGSPDRHLAPDPIYNSLCPPDATGRALD